MSGAFWTGAHAAAWCLGYLTVLAMAVAVLVVLAVVARRIRFRHQVRTSARRARA